MTKKYNLLIINCDNCHLMVIFFKMPEKPAMTGNRSFALIDIESKLLYDYKGYVRGFTYYDIADYSENFAGVRSTIIFVYQSI